MQRLPALLLALLCLLPLAAQGDSVFRIKVTMKGVSGEASFSSSLEIGYAPCAIWVGGSGGWTGSPAQFLAETGGLAAIRPGMSLPFYAKGHNGSARGSDGSSAEVITTGPGFARWTERDKDHTSVKQNDASEQPDHHQSARFYRTAAGARIADFDLGLVSAGLGGYIGCANPYAMEIDGQEVVKFCSFELTRDELANFKQVHKTKSASFKDASGSVDITAELYAELEDPGEVDVEVLDDYEGWMPKGNLDDENRPGNSIRVKAKVYATGQPGQEADRKARIFFELQDVGSERGVCLNWPLSPKEGKADLRLIKDENPRLEADSKGLEDFNLKSKGLVKEAELKVSAFDFGAWGLLRVRAEDKDGKPLKVTYRGKVKSALALPKDEDHNHIADSWQEAKGVFGLPSDWDEAEVAGQSTKGDGFGLYQKYRGLVVSTPGGRQHTRLEPKEKHHFFIDPQNLVDLDRWWSATSIRGHRVFESWTQGRRVDIHRGHGAGVGKWATLFRRDDTPVPDHPTKKEKDFIFDQRAMTQSNPSGGKTTPRHVDFCVIFPCRIVFALEDRKADILTCLKNPTTDVDRTRAQRLLGLGLPAEEIIRRIEALGPQDLQALALRVAQWTAIHEAAHACGLPGHLGENGKESEVCPNRVRDCPMQYPTFSEDARLLLFGEIGGQGRCCSTAPHECFKGLSPKG